MHDELPSEAGQFCRVEDVFIAPDRQRRSAKDPKPLLDLKRGILSKGLLHPPVLARRIEPVEGEPHFQLIAGERRIHAIGELHADGLQFCFNGVPVPQGLIPYTTIGQLSPDDLEEAELEENLLRVQLTWLEEAEAKKKIFELRKAKNPEVLVKDVGAEIAIKTGKEPERERQTLIMAEVILPYKDTPVVKNAKSLDRAYHAVLDIKKARLARDLRQLAPKASPYTIIHGDFLEQTFTKGSFDLILADPPYGINMHQQAFDKRHEYDDSKDTALRFYREIFRRGFDLLKVQGTIFLFCDVEHFTTIRTFAESMAFSTWRTPIIWHKGLEGAAPWGKNGFTRTYETILFAVKGQRPLQIGPEPDVKAVRRNTKSTSRLHAAEKPPELIRWLLQLACKPGDSVLDPCCGSAPILLAAKGLGLSLTLVEKSEEYHATACLRAQEAEETTTPDIEDQVKQPFTLGDLDEEMFGS